MSWVDVLTALKATRNYGAKVGGVIAGSLGRGGGGRFARVGSGDAQPAPKAGKAKRGDVLKAAGVSEAEAKALEDFLAGKPVDEDALAGLYDKGLIDYTSDEKPLANAQGRALAGALKKGDVRKATDATGRGGDRAKKRDAKKAPKDGKPKAGGGAKPKAPKPPKAAPNTRERDTGRLGKAENRVEEIAAQISSVDMGEAERVRAGNRLEELAAEVSKLNVDQPEQTRVLNAIAKARQALDAKASAPAVPLNRAAKESGLTVMKEASGRYRWVIVSSNAFEDKEREIVSEKALADDAERMDASGEYGPLRWWHVGDVEFSRPMDWTSATAGPGVDIGTCDFVALHEKMLIESGTFKDETVAQAVAKAAPHLQVSRGFTHPLGQPIDGVFTAIKGVERSLLPKGTAANAFTSVSVQEQTNMATLKEKWDAFKALFDGNEDAATKFAADVSSKSKELQAAGVAFKEDAPAVVAEASTEAKAEGDMPAADAAADAETEDMTESIGDMSVADLLANEEFLAGIMAVVGKSLEPVAESVEKAVGAQTEATTKEAGEIATLKGLVEKQAARIAALEGEAPKGQPGYMASVDAGNVVAKEIAPEKIESEIGLLVNSWLSSKK